MQHTHKNGKRVTKHLLVNMLHNTLIPDFGCSLKVAFNNIVLIVVSAVGTLQCFLHITIKCQMKVGDTVHSEFWYFSGRITSQEIKSKYHTLKKQNKKQTHKKNPQKTNSGSSLKMDLCITWAMKASKASKPLHMTKSEVCLLCHWRADPKTTSEMRAH